MRRFSEFAVIDWSGQAVARPKGLAVAHAATGHDAPELLHHDGGWSRAAIRDWLLGHADAGSDLLVGLDLSAAFPFIDEGAYFPGWDATPEDAKQLWALIDRIAAADDHIAASSFVAHAEGRRYFRQHGACGDLFPPGAGRMRACEHGQRRMGINPTSCFNLVGAAQVGKSSLTGMRVLHALRGQVPVWPFDAVPDRGPVIVEIYTAIAARAAGMRKGRSKIRDAAALDHALAALGSTAHHPLALYDDHATDAIVTTAWLRTHAATDTLWNPLEMNDHIAATEGWTFGVA